MHENPYLLDGIVEASHNLGVLVLLVAVELRIKDIGSPRYVRVGVRPALLVLLERVRLEVRRSGLEVLPELPPARVQLAKSRRTAVEAPQHLQHWQGSLHVACDA